MTRRSWIAVAALLPLVPLIALIWLLVAVYQMGDLDADF